MILLGSVFCLFFWDKKWFFPGRNQKKVKAKSKGYLHGSCVIIDCFLEEGVK